MSCSCKPSLWGCLFILDCCLLKLLILTDDLRVGSVNETLTCRSQFCRDVLSPGTLAPKFKVSKYPPLLLGTQVEFRPKHCLMPTPPTFIQVSYQSWWSYVQFQPHPTFAWGKHIWNLCPAGLRHFSPAILPSMVHNSSHVFQQETGALLLRHARWKCCHQLYISASAGVIVLCKLTKSSPLPSPGTSLITDQMATRVNEANTTQLFWQRYSIAPLGGHQYDQNWLPSTYELICVRTVNYKL